MKTKKLSEILDTFENFTSLLHMCLLFDKHSEYYKFSGFVTAALLDYDDPDNKISIIAINTYTDGIGWHLYTFKRTREELIKMLSECVECVGNTEKDSFIIENDV